VVADHDSDEVPLAEAKILAIWTDTDDRAHRIEPRVAHYLGQEELAAAIQRGLEGRL
jgi:hypothetical protein